MPASFDVKGLEIAALVLARFPGAPTPWRMTVEGYRDALWTEGRPLKLGAVRCFLRFSLFFLRVLRVNPVSFTAHGSPEDGII